MAIESLRRYIENRTELEDYIGVLDEFDKGELIKAEKDIDKAIASFYEGPWAQHNRVTYQLSTSEVTLTTTTATITNLTFQTGYFAFNTLEIVSGANRGKKIAISNSSLSGGTQTLTFFDTQTGLSGSPACKIYQSGKAPFAIDRAFEEGTYYITVPEFIKEATALQYKFRIDNKAYLEAPNKIKEYEVEGADYREEFDTSYKSTIQDRISPEAWDILDDKGLTVSSM